MFYCWKFEACRSMGCKIISHQTLRMIGPWPGLEPGQTGWLGPGPDGRLFFGDLRHWQLVTLKPFNLQSNIYSIERTKSFKKYTKNQEASSILKAGFVHSKWPHLHRAYLVRLSYWLRQTVWIAAQISKKTYMPKLNHVRDFDDIVVLMGLY